MPGEKRLRWGTLKRRTRSDEISSSAHEDVVTSVTPLLRATLVTGHRSSGCSPWADWSENSKLSDLMRILWRQVSQRLEREYDDEIAIRPTEHEAKRVKLLSSLRMYFIFSLADNQIDV